MQNKKEDRRSLYTKKVIKDSYIELLQSVPIEKINVTEICRRAEVNRSTFYIHFLDARDVLESIEKELFQIYADHFPAMVTEETMRQIVSNQMFGILFRHPYFVALVKTHNANRLTNAIMEHSKSLVIDACVNALHMAREEADIVLTYIISGSLAVETKWIMDGVDDIEGANNFLNQLTMNVVPSLDRVSLNHYFRKKYNHG